MYQWVSDALLWVLKHIQNILTSHWLKNCGRSIRTWNAPAWISYILASDFLNSVTHTIHCGVSYYNKTFKAGFCSGGILELLFIFSPICVIIHVPYTYEGWFLNSVAQWTHWSICVSFFFAFDNNGMLQLDTVSYASIFNFF